MTTKTERIAQLRAASAATRAEIEQREARMNDPFDPLFAPPEVLHVTSSSSAETSSTPVERSDFVTRDAPRGDLLYKRRDDALIGPVDDEGLTDEERDEYVTMGNLEDVAADLANASGTAIGILQRQSEDEIAQLTARLAQMEDVIDALADRVAALEAGDVGDQAA